MDAERQLILRADRQARERLQHLDAVGWIPQRGFDLDGQPPALRIRAALVCRILKCPQPDANDELLDLT